MNINSVSGISPQNLSDINNIKKEQAQVDNFKNSFDNAMKNDKEEELKEACVKFESYFLNMMFKSMRKTVVSGGGLFEKSNAQKIFEEGLDQELTKKMANEGGIGLADMMYKQLSRQNNAIDIDA
nr:rod-binding protein [uncultured Tyzzerella sp.]